MMKLVFPIPSFPNPLYDIYKSKQYRYLYQRPDCCCQRLIAVGSECSNCNSDGELKVVASSGKALCRRKLIPKTKLVCHEQGEKKDDCKVDDQRRRYPDDGDNLVDNLMSLGREEDEDGEEEAYQR